MATKILYSNKIVLQNDETIPSENKVTADDMNEIKEVVNNNADELETKQGKEEGKGLSTNDFTDELKEKLESLENYDDAELKQKNAEQDTNIQKNAESIEELKAENERLNNDINAISVTERAEGENITLNDTADGARFKEFVPRGNSWQKTRSGKNKYLADKESFTYKGLTITNNGDGTYTINGTSTGAGDWWLKEYETNAFDVLAPICELKEGESASITFEVLSGNVEIITEVNNFSIAGKLSDTNKQNIAYRSINDIMTNKKISWTYTATESTILANAQIYLSGEGNTFNNFKFRIQVELGTTATDYEEYGAMPSTQFKSDIQNVTGNANVTICNKNLFDRNFYNCAIGGSDGKLIFPDASCKTAIIRCKPNTQYTIVKNGGNRFLIANLDKKIEKGKIESLFNSNNSSKATIITNSNAKYLYVYVDNSNTDVELQIEENTTATDCVEHQSQSFTFPLAEGQRLMLNDYLADDGIHHKRKQIVLDGTEGFVLETSLTNVKRFFIRGLSWSSVSTGLCSHFNFINSYALDKEHVYVTSSGFLYVFADFTTADELKAYLAEQYANGTPVIVEYGLAEEEIEAYTEEQQAVYDEIKKTAHSYGEQTHIFSTDETSLIFNVEARKDMNTLETRIEKLESEV